MSDYLSLTFPLPISLVRSPYTLLSSLFTFLPQQVAASLGPGSFGAYVISQATCASDVLAVMLLQVCAISQRQCTALVVYESCWKELFSLRLFFGLFRGLRQFKLVPYQCSSDIRHCDVSPFFAFNLIALFCSSTTETVWIDLKQRQVATRSPSFRNSY